MQHWIHTSLVFVSEPFVIVDKVHPLYRPTKQLSCEPAGIPMPQQIADVTFAEVEPAIAPMFASIGIVRYPTFSVAVRVPNTFISTNTQGVQPTTYARAANDLLSSDVRNVSLTIRAEHQMEENLIGVLRAGNRMVQSNVNSLLWIWKVVFIDSPGHQCW